MDLLFFARVVAASVVALFLALSANHAAPEGAGAQPAAAGIEASR